MDVVSGEYQFGEWTGKEIGLAKRGDVVDECCATDASYQGQSDEYVGR